MMRYVSLCLVLFTVACGPSNDNSSDLQSRRPKKKPATTTSDWSNPVDAGNTTATSPNTDWSNTVDAGTTPVSGSGKSSSSTNLDYPIAADPTLTPGLRCTHPDETRYPEHIAYCSRSVTKSKKDRVIRAYDNLGFKLEEMDRSKIKIDHFIPLCMGGDNDTSNLWPQYEAVYSKTDMIESQICLALSRGLITQDESIDQMLYAKANLDEAPAVLAKIKALLR